MDGKQFRRSSMAFWLSVLAVLAIVVVLGRANLGVMAIGLVCGWTVRAAMQRWGNAFIRDRALEHMCEILVEGRKNGPLGPENRDYVLANGIAHGLCYLRVLRSPDDPGSEFQLMCHAIDDESDPE